MNVREKSASKNIQKRHKIDKISTFFIPFFTKSYEGRDFLNIILNCLTLVLTKALRSIPGVLQVGPQFGK